MCGIAGVFELGRDEGSIDAALLTRMRDTLTHRGPDDAGLYLSPDRTLGLAHRRLSIIDLSAAGRQPMSNEDGTVWITFNGEIYNHLALRKELETRGHTYRSKTDTETLVHLYEEEGEDFVQRIEGDFALAIWDARRRKLVLARDRLGVKPLYYALLPNAFLFGSEIKAILAHPRVSRQIDRAALYHYLTFVAAPAPRTLFQGIHKLPPATLLVIEANRPPRTEVYWDPLQAPVDEAALSGDPERCATRIREGLASAIEKRMMSDVPFGVFLSGGLDSSANVALMSRLMDRPVRTFSVGFREHPAYNEFEYARKVARLFKTEHHEVEIDWKNLLEAMPGLVFHQDEPIADWVCVPLHFVSALARSTGTTVIQVGEGSDEQFFGYEGYRRAYVEHLKAFERLLRLPRTVRQGAYGAARGLARLLHRGGDRLELLRKAAAEETLFWGGIIAWSESDKLRLLSPGERARCEGLSSHEVVLDHDRHVQRVLPQADFGQRMIYLELKNRLAELLLMRVDKITMASSIEARVPFLDHHLVEFSMHVPTDLKLGGGRTKDLLKRAMRGILPDEIIDRPKQGFGAPVSEWFRGDLYRPAVASILDSRLREEGVFDYAHVSDLFRAHKEGKAEHGWHLWTLYNLSRWYDFWIAGEARG